MIERSGANSRQQGVGRWRWVIFSWVYAVGFLFAAGASGVGLSETPVLAALLALLFSFLFMLAAASAAIPVSEAKVFEQYRPRAAWHPAYVVAWPLFLMIAMWRHRKLHASSGEPPSRLARAAVIGLCIATIGVGVLLLTLGILGIKEVGSIAVALWAPATLCILLATAILVWQRRFLRQEDIESVKAKSIFGNPPDWIVHKPSVEEERDSEMGEE
jgi:hypothetical protein